MANDNKIKATGDGPKSGGHRSLVIAGFLVATVIVVTVWWSGPSSTLSDAESASKWKIFVSVEGQPEPVPAEWVATPEGRFAHSIKLPDPLPADSGYREEMTSKEYWEHLCKTEAGEFIYESVDNVEGFYFMRPPGRPSDDDLKHRFELEAPEIERTYQLRQPAPEYRGRIFVNPPWAKYRYVEEPSSSADNSTSYVHISGYRQDTAPMKVEATVKLQSKYGITWRGIRRENDRDLAIAGSEWIVLDFEKNEVMALQRNFALTGWVKRAPEGIWWLNAAGCPNVPTKNIFGERFYAFVTKVLKPKSGGVQ
jgi:hypothetical protein